MEFYVRFNFLTEDGKPKVYVPYGVHKDYAGGLRLLDLTRELYGDEIKHRYINVNPPDLTYIEVGITESSARALGDLFKDTQLVEVDVYHIEHAPPDWQVIKFAWDSTADAYLRPDFDFLFNLWKSKGCPPWFSLSVTDTPKEMPKRKRKCEIWIRKRHPNSE